MGCTCSSNEENKKCVAYT